VPEGDDRGGFRLKGEVTVGELLTAIAIIVGTVVFYFGGQGNMVERINKVESDLSERIGKLETRVAVGEQHQIQSDAFDAETKTQLNSFAGEVRGDLKGISDHLDEMLRSPQKSSDGMHR
jgi:uncharacterized membrane protein